MIRSSGSVEVGHGEHRLGLAIDTFFETSSGSAGAAGMPEVAHQEEEGEHELGCTQPLAQVHEVYRAPLGELAL